MYQSGEMYRHDLQDLLDSRFFASNEFLSYLNLIYHETVCMYSLVAPLAFGLPKYSRLSFILMN